MADSDELFPSSLCSCSLKAAVHVHCPCSMCNGKAVNRRTQLRHLASQTLMSDSNVELESQLENLSEIQGKLFLSQVEN